MKVLFTIRSTSHLPYVSSIIDAFKDDTVEVLFDRGWSSKDSKWMKTRNSKLVFCFRELRSYASYINRNQSSYYINRWNSYLPWGLRWVARLGWVKYLLSIFPFKMVESLIPADKNITNHIKDINPDVIIATPTTHRFSSEVEYIKSAKKINIPTVVVNLSWDNLSTKGTFHIQPDILMVWNESQRAEAQQYHNVDNIQVIGSPFFDKWFKPIELEDRSEFCKRMGLDSDKPFVLYLGSSAKIAPDETDIIVQIYDRLDMGMLIRAHPANSDPYAKLNIPMQPTNLPESDEQIRDFYNAIKHSHATVGINTSAMMDSIILGKRCIAILVDRYDATQRDCLHFKQLREYIELTRSVGECVDRINSSAKVVRSSEDFIWDFVRPKGVTFSAARLFMVEFINWYRKEQRCHAKRNLNTILST